jgi:F-type H+-transporting ATPase subunit a
VSRRAIFFGIALFTVLSFVLSFLVLKPAKPVIEIRGEALVKISGDGTGIMDVVILNTLFTAWVVMAIVLIFWIMVARRRSMVPSGLYNLGEAVIDLIDNFVTGIAGEKNGRRFFPLIATLFIYIAFANWLSLTPVFNAIGIFEPLGAEKAEFHKSATVFKDSGGLSLIVPGAEDIKVEAETCDALSGEAQVACREHAIEEATHGKVKDGEKVGILAPYLRGINTDLMTPASFAIVAVFLIQWWGVRSLGFFGYASKFVNFKGPIDFFVGFLETIAEIAKLISFSFRLFGNLLAGEILLLVMTFLIPLVSTFLIIFYGLELFVGAVQAFVFGALTLVFASLAVSHHGGGGEEHHEHTEAAGEAGPAGH